MTNPKLTEKVIIILAEMCGYTIPPHDDFVKSKGVRQAHQAIMEAIRESVPKPHQSDWEMGDMQENLKSIGHNACREEMLRRLQ